jgi:hypothetical protein
MATAVYQRATDNILAGITPTATVAPSTSYSLSTLASMNPAARVKWSVTTVTITFTITSAQGDIFVLPMHNLDPGSSVLTLTNGAGFSHALTIPAVQANGFPPTLVVDLTALSGTRTSTTWNLVIAGNSVNVQLGGCVAIYGPKRTFLDAVIGGYFAPEFHERETAYISEVVNEYGTAYVHDYEAVTRQIEILIRADSPTGLGLIRDWFRANHGRATGSLFWPDTSVVDAYVGRWQTTFDVQHTTAYYKPIPIVFDELSKGKAF